MPNASDLDWRCWFLLSRGAGVDEISIRTEVERDSIPARISRVDEDIQAAKDRFASQVRAPRLEPCFGSSGKALATMTCADVHPCRNCDGADCAKCGGAGIRPLDGDRSPFFCPVCDRSGWDDLPTMWPVPMPAPEPVVVEQTS